MTKRERSKLQMELQNIASCDINNLMIDVGNIAKELDDDNNCPIRFKYIIKGVYEELYRLRTNTGSKITEAINGIGVVTDL